MPQHELLPTSGRRACHALRSRRAHLNFSCSAMLPFCAKAQHSLIRAPLCARPRPVLRTFDRAIIFICLNRDAGVTLTRYRMRHLDLLVLQVASRFASLAVAAAALIP
jgi:hypothetical protein